MRVVGSKIQSCAFGLECNVMVPDMSVNCEYRANPEDAPLTEPVHRTLTKPNVPDNISAQGIIALDGLFSFVVNGTGSLPSGSLPEMPTSLHDLELSNTALGPLDSSLFAANGSLSKLETLVLVQNTNMGPISDGIPNLSLKSLCVPVRFNTMTFNNSHSPGRYNLRAQRRFLRTSSPLQWPGA